MAKAIRSAITAAFVVFAVVTLGRVDIAFTAFGLSGASAAAALTFASTLITSAIGMMTSKGINASAGNFGSKFATRAPLAPRQITVRYC